MLNTITSKSSPSLGIAVSADAVYFTGEFQTVSGTPRPGLAAVDSAAGTLLPWSPEPVGEVRALAVSGDRVYIGGRFTKIGGNTACTDRNAALTLRFRTRSHSSGSPATTSPPT